MLVISTNTASAHRTTGKRVNGTALGITPIDQAIRQATYQGRRVSQPNPELESYRRRIKVLAVTVTIVLILAMIHLVITVIDAGKQAHPADSPSTAQVAEVSQVTGTAQTMSLTLPTAYQDLLDGYPALATPTDLAIRQLGVADLTSPILPFEETVSSIGTANTDASTSIATTEDATAETTNLAAPEATADPSTDTTEQSITEEATATESTTAEPPATSTATPTAPGYETVIPLSTRQKMAKVLYREAGSLKSDSQRSMVVWTFFNRYDSGVEWFGGTLDGILTKPNQYAWNPNTPVTERDLALVNDVCERWWREQQGETDVGRTLENYVYYFVADGEGGNHNRFYWTDEPLRGDKHWLDYNHPIANPYGT